MQGGTRTHITLKPGCVVTRLRSSRCDRGHAVDARGPGGARLRALARRRRRGHACSSRGSRHRWRSSRIRPTPRCSSSSSRPAGSASSTNGSVGATDFLDLRGAIAAGGERGLLGLAFAPDYAIERTLFRQLHQPGRGTRSSRGSSDRPDPLVADPASRFDLLWGAARQRVHRTAIREPQRRQPRVRAGRVSLHRPWRRRIRGRSESSRAESVGVSRQDAAHRRERAGRTSDRLPGAADEPVRCGWPDRHAAARSGASVCAIRGAIRSIRRRAAAPARSSSATSGRGPGRKSTTSRPGRGGRNYGWRNQRRRARPRHVAAAGIPAADRSHSSNTTTRSASRSPAASSIAAPRSAPVTSGATSLPTTCRVACGRSVSRLIPRRATRRRRRESDHTADLGGGAVVGNISSFGVDADGELYIVNHTGGSIVQVLSLPVLPVAPTGLHIVG